MSDQDARGGTYIVFTVSGATYALPSTAVRHMEMVEQVTRVPNAPAFVDGVVFTRGLVVPVLNLRARFGFERRPIDLRTRLVVVQSGARTVWLIADDAREFIVIPPASIQPPHEALTGGADRYLDGVAALGQRLILILNLEPILNFVDPVVAA